MHVTRQAHKENFTGCCPTMEDINRLRYVMLREKMALSKHAEETVIDKYKEMLRNGIIKKNMRSKLSVLVVRVLKDGTLKESKPCDNCVKIMREVGIKKVTYSSQDERFVTESLVVIVTRPSVGSKCIRESLAIIKYIIENKSLYKNKL